MSYVSTTYMNSTGAPVGKWTCAPTSALGPFSEAPSGDDTKGQNLCGQCVSYVKAVCPSLPATRFWEQGEAVKDNKTIVSGTVIATFNASGVYEGHAAIYVSQNPVGISVYDQYVSGQSPKPVGSRILRWNGKGNSNNGDKFYVVE